MSYIKHPKTKRGEITLRKICSAAEQLFSEKGYYSTDIGDITRRAGISTGTFYVYFSDKLSIFRYLMSELGHQLRQEIKGAKLNSTSVIEMEALGMGVFFGFVSRHKGLFAIVWQSQFVDPESFKDYYERFSRGYVKELESAKERGEIRDFNPEILSYCLMGIYNFMAVKGFLIEGEAPDDEAKKEILDFIKHGICNR